MSEVHRVLILGSGGMLGSECSRLLKAEPSWRVATASRDGSADYRFDVESGEGPLVDMIEAEACDLIINCVAVLASDIDEEPQRMASAVLVNSWFPHVLASVAGRHGCNVVHVSTDGVFSGKTTFPLSEAAEPDAVDVYGLSKRLGESTAPNVLTVRCSIVGRDRRGRGITEWYLGSNPSVPVRGFVDYRWTPVTVPQLARFFHGVIATSDFDRLRGAGPILHYAPNAALSKFDYLSLLRRSAQHGPPIEPANAPTGPVCRELTSSTRSAEPPAPVVDWDILIAELLHAERSI